MQRFPFRDIGSVKSPDGQVNQHNVPQPAGGGVGEREAFEGIRDRAVGSAGLPPVSSSLSPRFGVPAPLA